MSDAEEAGSAYDRFAASVAEQQSQQDRRRQRTLTLAAVASGLVALLPAAVTAWLAAFTVTGFSGGSTPFDVVKLLLEIVLLLLTGLLLATFPAVMTLGTSRRRWLRVALIPVILVPMIGLTWALATWLGIPAG